MTNTLQEALNRDESLPQYYGEDRLVILPRDPYCLFTYWEISQPTRDKLKHEWGEERWGKSTLQMRIYKHSWSREAEVENYYDVKISDEADSWYLQNLESDRTYHAELGWQLPGGCFEPLLCSNAVRTPRDGLSDIIDAQWQLPDWKARKLYRRISLYHLSSPELFRRRKQRS